MLDNDSLRHLRVGSGFNFTAALFVPLLLVVVVGFKNRSIVELHHGTLALLAGRFVPTEPSLCQLLPYSLSFTEVWPV